MWSQIYESVILLEIKKVYTVNPAQFGFKKSSSYAHAIFVLQRLVEEAKRRKRRLYAVPLDASKAFNKVERVILWTRMCNVGIHACFLLSMERYYENFLLLVVKPNEISNVFTASTGFKQGGSVSSWLFKIYFGGAIDVISSVPGARIGIINLSVVLFADDMMILFPLYSFSKRDCQG